VSHRLSIASLVVAAATVTAHGQQSTRLSSPEVLPGNRVVFRLRVPHASEVLLALEGSPRIPFKEGDDGVWSVTTAPLEPDYYAYFFVVDGTAIVDPSNSATRPNLLNQQSVLHVPGRSPLPWEVQTVPHGTVHHHFYKSRVAGDERDFYVYTPPGYDARARERYPVLYLQHGYSGDARGWVDGAPANVILDNLIAEGRAKPMLLVMSLGYGIPNFVQRGEPNQRSMEENYARFKDALLTEVIPAVEQKYQVATDRNSRAIAGLSMGGTEALYVGLNAPDRFAWVGSFSAGGMSENPNAAFPAVEAKINRRLRLLWIACGTEDPLIDANRLFRRWLMSKGVGFTAVETRGRHTWMVWRRNFVAFVPELFKNP
jgi:enterochelin esterase family protein